MARKKRKWFTSKERKAYLIGIGISLAVHGDAKKALEHSNPQVRRSVQSGYEADNRRNAGLTILDDNVIHLRR